MKQILEAGIEPEYSDDLVGKIRIANLSSILLMMNAIGFIIISMIFTPEIVLIPIIGFLLFIATPVLNVFKLHTPARIAVALVPVLIAIAFNTFLMQPGQTIYPLMLAIILSFAVQPFIIFGINEKRFLIPIGLLIVASLASISFINGIVNIKLDNSFFGNIYFEAVMLAFATLNIYGQIFFLLQKIKKEEDGNKKLVKKFKKVIKQAEQRQKDEKKQQEKMEAYLEEIEKRNEEDKKRNWISEGLALFSNKLRSSNSNINELFDDIIAELCRYLNATQGGIYIEENEGEKKYLALVAAYAYQRKKHINQKFEIDEGLLGMSFMEQEHVYLREIPEDYVRITSGLGDANPNRLLIVPLKSNDETVGVIEFASFNEFEPYMIEFLNQLGEIFAGSILSLKIQDRTNSLLHEAQSNTEALRAQEEEMRQNMEEMQATQEEFYRKEKEYLKIIEELKNSNN